MLTKLTHERFGVLNVGVETVVVVSCAHTHVCVQEHKVCVPQARPHAQFAQPGHGSWQLKKQKTPNMSLLLPRLRRHGQTETH